jgi:GNAT superfamily N-acetyltransferase
VRGYFRFQLSLRDIEALLFERRVILTYETIKRPGEPIDEKAHSERLRYRFNDAHIICRGSERLGLFKFYRAPNVWTIVQIQIAPKHRGNGIAARSIGEFLEQADNAHVPVMLLF